MQQNRPDFETERKTLDNTNRNITIRINEGPVAIRIERFDSLPVARFTAEWVSPEANF